ncbi:MAG: Cof-type HAD-IIB family hydrolase [Propionicimonas sp.]
MNPHTALVRLIASDLDGTFLRDDKTISGRTLGAVRAATAAGIAVIAATGRQAQQLPEEVADSGVRHVVASNGAIGFDLVERRVLFQDLLTPSTAAAIVAYFTERLPDARFSAVRDHGARHAAEPGYTDLLSEMERVARWWRIDTEPLADVVSEPTLKLTVRHPWLDADELLAILAESGLPGFHATTSGAPFLEIAGDGVTKASGVARLCQLLDVDASEVLAAGDARNDVELISWAGLGVAMGNAVPEAQAAADWVTASNEDDGLALAIESVLAGRAAAAESR